MNNQLKEDRPLKQQWEEFALSPVWKRQTPFDLGIVCSFGYMIPVSIINKFRHGMIVIHPSLIPKYRGAAPIQHVLLNQEKETGVSYLEISPHKFDAGKVLSQVKTEISEDDNYLTLSKKLSQISQDHIQNLLENLEQLRLSAQPQSDAEVTPAPKLKLIDTYTNFEKYNSKEIIAQHKAFKGTNFGGLRAKYDEKVFFLDEIDMPLMEEYVMYLSKYVNAKPGSIWLIKTKKSKHFFYIKCREGFIKVIRYRPLDKTVREAFKFIDQYLDKSK